MSRILSILGIGVLFIAGESKGKNSTNSVLPKIAGIPGIPLKIVGGKSTERLQLSLSSGKVNIPSKEERIIGGSDSSPGQWPWQAVVFNSVSINDDYYFLCGATLVKSYWAVSAAQCFRPFPYSAVVWFGVTDLTDDNHKQSRYVDTAHFHPDSSAFTGYGDIVLLELSTEVKFNSYVKPVPLPSSQSTVSAGRKCIITGFGSTKYEDYAENLQFASVEIISRQTCNNWYSSDNFVVPSDQFCAGYQQGGVDACAGDAGGPLVCQDSGEYVLYGVTSYGIGCAEPGNPGTYTDVTEYIEWIDETSGVAARIASISCMTISTITAIVVLF